MPSEDNNKGKEPTSSSLLLNETTQQQRPEKRVKVTTVEEDVTTTASLSPTTTTAATAVATIPTFSSSLSKSYSSKQFSKAFATYQAVYLPKFSRRPKSNDEESTSTFQKGEHDDNDDDVLLSWKDLSNIYSNLSKEDQESWCIETAPPQPSAASPEGKEENNQASKKDKASISPIPPFAPVDFLRVQQTTTTTTTNNDDSRNNGSSLISLRYYCSFLIQKDLKMYQDICQKLPVSTIFVDNNWIYEPCLWIFFGRNNCSNNNNETEDLQGRPEHTDSISHDGTWHYQLNGTKRWHLRPTPKLLQHIREQQEHQRDDDDDDDDEGEDKIKTLQKGETWDENTHIEIECQKGDIIVVNTRLWYHQTVIPPTTSQDDDVKMIHDDPSVSYARDFWTKTKTQTGTTMTNVDGLYATDDIEAGTVVFREDDMPDCELHRSKTNPNCEVVELEDGTGAVVASRPINSGEFFCVPESSSEEEGERDYDEEMTEDEDDEEG